MLRYKGCTDKEKAYSAEFIKHASCLWFLNSARGNLTQPPKETEDRKSQHGHSSSFSHQLSGASSNLHDVGQLNKERYSLMNPHLGNLEICKLGL